MLYPRASETRETVSLDGLWKFKFDFDNRGIEERWFERPLGEDAIRMAVPSSYNEIMTDWRSRDHIGMVWYERGFFAPEAWKQKRIDIRIGAAAHHAIVYVNGQEVARHKGGFLPFAADISAGINWNAENRITICVDNRLDWQCLPPGCVAIKKESHSEYLQQETHFDFFHYSGIHRSVFLVATPCSRIEDITLTTTLKNQDASVAYAIDHTGKDLSVTVRLLDRKGTVVAQAQGGSRGVLDVHMPALWQPGSPYLYTFEVSLCDTQSRLVDRYRLPMGIRTVAIDGTRFLINGKPFYFKGFGMHEDKDIKGKGHDDAFMLRDFTLLKWIGANSFRTSHYPYSEETMNLADEMGIVIIDEAPAVGMIKWSGKIQVFSPERINDATLGYHKQVMTDLIARDKNHPSVVIWSVGNEPASDEEASGAYFAEVIRHTKSLDPSRPVTLAECTSPQKTHVSGLVDVLCVNRYQGWYFLCGRPDLIYDDLIKELGLWHERFGKPLILSEFGADTIAGMHALPSTMFSEEYQRDVYKEMCRAIDTLDYVVGEHPWNFADFATKQGVNRVMGNRKGVFTRQRQPKAAAFQFRERWSNLEPKWK